MKFSRAITHFAALSIMYFIINVPISGQSFATLNDTISLKVKTYDGLELPARVIKNSQNDKKMILFINGSTPYDEKGNLGAFWNSKGKLILEKQDFYLRFLDILPSKGYSVATMAKRSFVYPVRIPRPNLSELALDIKSYIEVLMSRGLLKDEKDLVIVGYSEGSIVASKVLGILKKQPYACILLGSANLSFDCNIQSLDDFYLTDVLRSLKNWSDEQIKTELSQLCQIHKELANMDEEQFENKYKNSNPFGFGFAMWESYYIDREVALYDPVPNLLYANIPVLICIGEDDNSMPLTSAKKIYERLNARGLAVTLRSIEKENHQYEKYDVFAIIDTWLNNHGLSTDFTLQNSDSLIIAKYAENSKLIKELSAIPYGGGYPERVSVCYKEAIERNITEENTWFTLGLKLFADGFNNEAYNSFSRAADSTFALHFASLVWMGHLKDLEHQRKEALELYQKALAVFPGFPVQHDNWNIVIDEKWIEERIKVPFKGIKNE
ncbi:MAG TPA: alpha/beta hydrolase [Bacteroidales bacterium]|nr:alpha/beta hydrolase [Bacteroidales bacterium]